MTEKSRSGKRGGRSRRKARIEHHNETPHDESVEGDDQDSPPPERELVGEPVVRAARIFNARPEDFREAGFRCDRCGWSTRKRGFSGRQAIRAHSKKHVRERRSVSGPVKVQLLMVALAISLYFLVPVAIGMPVLVGTVLPTLMLIPVPPDGVMQAAAVCVPPVLVALHFIVATRFSITGRKPTGRLERIVLAVNAGALPVIAVIAAVPGVFIWPGWFAGFVLLALWNIVGAAGMGRVRLDMARREFKPSGYSPLFRAASTEVQQSLLAFRYRLRRMIERGSLDPRRMAKGDKRLLRSLGLGSVKKVPQKPRTRSGR